MKASEIRQKYLAFFKSYKHLVMPSSSLIPSEDTSVLLTTAGMQQMMPFFLGTKKSPGQRIVTIQKCFRTNDIDEVGDAHHHTFFEMLGNFSVGNYFKKEAVSFAFEFLTKHLNLPKEKLWITIHPTEDTADKAWIKQGIPANRIFVDETNFWGPPGETGPCGPDSEIYFDFGRETGCGKETCSPLCDCGRFLEIWNLVFMEFFQDKKGQRTKLPNQNIDTGMGLERIARVLQRKNSAYETDLFEPIINAILKALKTDISIQSKPENTRNIRIIADHTRAAVFMAGDGITPSNLGRGYVMRRIIRRALRSGYLLQKAGEKNTFLDQIINAVINTYAGQYPELKTKQNEIKIIVTEEEKNFLKTLENGLKLLRKIKNKMLETGKQIITGKNAFDLYDTYGFPLELTREIAKEEGLKLDEKGFVKAMEEQKKRSRKSSQFSVQLNTKIYQDLAKKLAKSEFIGYEKLKIFAKILAIVVNKTLAARANKNQEVEIVLDKTPFYARAGGQIGDSGIIFSETGKVEITDTRYANGLIIHLGQVIDGIIEKNQKAEAIVNQDLRKKTACHHTATHILHQALREVLGSSIKQAGSSVDSKKLRFDFTFPRKLTPEEINQIEKIVNEKVKQKLPVKIQKTSLAKAKEQNIIALFDEKYAATVRIINIGNWSKELCGGTHIKNTSCIKGIKIIKQESVAGGTRRIKATII